MIRNIMVICNIAVILTFFASVTTVQAYANDPYVYQSAYELVGVYDAWKFGTGSKDVIVAVIDNGFDHYHPDLVQNVWKNTNEIPNNNIDDDNNGYIDDIVGWNFVPEDVNEDGIVDDSEKKGNNNPRPTLAAGDSIVSGHGTAVAGIIGATGYNNYLGTGINWRVSLMNLKIVGNSGSGTISYVPDAIRYAVDNGADVISMSVVGILANPDAINSAIAYAHQKNVIVVAAAGNTSTDLNEDPYYPVCSDAKIENEQVLGVSAVTLDRAFASFSNYGDECIDITAPGVMISSTVRYGDVGDAILAEPYRGGLQGTSFSTPFVAGTAALIRSTYPRLTATQVMQAILDSTSKTPTDYDDLYINLFGAGFLQVDAALSYAQQMAQKKEISIENQNGTLYQLAPHVAVLSNMDLQTYYVGDMIVRQTVKNKKEQPISMNTNKTLAYVLSTYDSLNEAYTISVYHTQGLKLRDITIPSKKQINGIFIKGDALYGYILTDTGAQTYLLTERGLISDIQIAVPELKSITFDSTENHYVLQQYLRTISAWTPEDGILASQFIPLSFGTPQFITTIGPTIVSQFEEVGVVWNGNLDAIQIFSYITK